MSIKQKFIATCLSIIFIAMTIYLAMNYEYITEGNLDKISTSAKNDNEYEITTVPNVVERYKIINITYTDDTVYAILHLDNGNIKVLKIHEAYVDSALKNINEGYLYREGMQIYIRKE